MAHIMSSLEEHDPMRYTIGIVALSMVAYDKFHVVLYPAHIMASLEEHDPMRCTFGIFALSMVAYDKFRVVLE
jgi:hypothetical protein